jgi:hypothetical protein
MDMNKLMVIRGAMWPVVTAMVCWSVVASAAADRQDSWEVYVNVRYSFRGCYPASLFKPEPPPENQDGQAFTASDGAVLKMFGQNNPLRQSLRDAFLENVRAAKNEFGGKVKTHIGASWFVVFGSGPTHRSYEKTIQEGDRFKTLQLRYATERERTYEPIIPRMSACFQSLPGR